jgi:hypothetical protein
VPVLGSIANAIYDAVGVRITELPITPERVLRALRELRGEVRGVHSSLGSDERGCEIPARRRTRRFSFRRSP